MRLLIAFIKSTLKSASQSLKTIHRAFTARRFEIPAYVCILWLMYHQNEIYLLNSKLLKDKARPHFTPYFQCLERCLWGKIK